MAFSSSDKAYQDWDSNSVISFQTSLAVYTMYTQKQFLFVTLKLNNNYDNHLITEILAD